MQTKPKVIEVGEPKFVWRLFNTTTFAWLWLILRVWLGIQWLQSGLGKLGNPAWMNGGAALKGFWTNAVALPEGGRPPIAFDWYRDFINFMLQNEWYVWFGPLIAIGETLIGLGLIVGMLTGIAAFFGGLMNWNFIMAGTASTNALLFVFAILIMLAWRVAGWYGLDRWVLPKLGTPWGEVKVTQSGEPIQGSGAGQRILNE
jgi:thiosulfate dehydrogenase [quinone] large subunit